MPVSKNGENKSLREKKNYCILIFLMEELKIILIYMMRFKHIYSLFTY